jgi:hypothetical protein
MTGLKYYLSGKFHNAQKTTDIQMNHLPLNS